MTDTATDTALNRALQGVAQWRDEARNVVQAKLAECDREERRLRETIRSLERELEAVLTLRDEIRGGLGDLDREQSERDHAALLASLREDQAQLTERSAALADAHAEMHAVAEDMLADPDLAPTVAEYERFTELEGTLSALPAGYRHAILAHHEAVRRRLAPIFLLAEAQEATLDDHPPAPVSLVASLETLDGRPESLVFLLPVGSDRYTAWGQATEDLGTRMAYRAVAVAARVAAALGVADAPLSYRDFEGYLSIQLWLGDHEIGALIATEVERLAAEEFGDRALHIRAAGVEVQIAWVHPDVLNPPLEDPVLKVRTATVLEGAATEGAPAAPGE